MDDGIELKERLLEIRSHPRFAEVSSRPLGHFWEESWDRAPFEEAMTIKQLSEFDLAVLLKKRPMNQNRIVLILQALEKALKILDEDKKDLEKPKLTLFSWILGFGKGKKMPG